MDRTYFFDRLYPLQDAVFREMAAVDTRFYLTGGTAASRGYLGHRFSDDLDFFVNDEPLFALWSDRVTASLAAHAEWTTRVLLRESRFVRLELAASDMVLKLEFVNDVPSRVGEVIRHPILGRLDSAGNILANKLTALADRDEPKDIADIWGFCCRKDMPIGPALTSASSKAAGLFPPDIARRLLSASEADWRVIKWIDPPDVSSFLGDLQRLGEALLLLPPPA